MFLVIRSSAFTTKIVIILKIKFFIFDFSVRNPFHSIFCNEKPFIFLADATHFVSRIAWGANTVVTAQQNVSSKQELIELEGAFESVSLYLRTA